MSKFLLLDVGAGTLDILYYDDEAGLHYKAVVKSPVRTVAEQAQRLKGNLLVRGTEMGGGPVSEILTARAKSSQVLMTPSAALTLHHHLERVRASGIQVIDEAEAASLWATGRYSTLTLGDLEIPRLRSLVEAFGVPFSFDVVGVCAQDHGRPPHGVSHLDFRHSFFKSKLDRDPFPHALLYSREEIPPPLNRLRAIAESATQLPGREIYVMDSGMAAILGGTLDPQIRSNERILVLDLATSHTLGAALEHGEIAGFFEYHTRDITLHRLESLVRELAEGQLAHESILQQGGHGAYVRKGLGFDRIETIVATGPKRGLVENSRLPIRPGTPLGDHMMTGTAGLLEAIRRRKRLDTIPIW
ncbi:MAG: DUF1786 domain-containing protein [Desulfobacterota bacterium]|jgi:uncharacterized protein (DUF1786 family)|nr:DUF1786 domain-containing protein [Thermodesulfobacteriota bacterium]